MAHPQIATFARLAKENTPPARAIAGQMTRLSRTMHDIFYDALHDEIVVTNPFSQAVLTFRGNADGEEPPIRVIQGPSTGMDAPDKFGVDPVHDEIFVPNDALEEILVFPRLANGDAAPIRRLRGTWTPGNIAVDPVHNLIIVGVDPLFSSLPAGQSADRRQFTQILMFNRTDNGEAKPRAVITGSNTGLKNVRQIAVYPEKGYIFASQHSGSYFLGIWSVNDNGNIAPRWKMGGPKSELAGARGVAIDPKHKEVIAASGQNAVLTYYFPEVF